ELKDKILRKLPDELSKQLTSKIQNLEKELEHYDSRQGSLKWMLVTSFGYLGYRNAKFGKLESHEAVTAYGRDKILTAKEISEKNGFRTLNIIVDCVFIQKENRQPVSSNELEDLCNEITEATGVEMSIDGVFSWMLFFTAVADSRLTVANRYLGRFSTGGLKYRGIALRRKDTTEWIKDFQKEILEFFEKCQTIKEILDTRENLEVVYFRYRDQVRSRKIPWRKLLIRRTASKERSEYSAENATLLMMRELEENLQSGVQAGEKIKYLVMNEGCPDKSLRYLSEERAQSIAGKGKSPPYDTRYYERVLWKAFKEIWESFAPHKFYFDELKTGQFEMFG
ncbi:MAG: DNA polymerase domain-containing protein, partial [Leptospirales bacterium]